MMSLTLCEGVAINMFEVQSTVRHGGGGGEGKEALVRMAALPLHLQAFPLSLSTWTFFTMSIAQLASVLSTVSFLTAKFRLQPYIQINTALAMLAAHVAAVLISLYVTYTAVRFVLQRQLWALEGFDSRVERLALPYCISTSISLASLCYTNWTFFSYSVEHVKAKFINPRSKPASGSSGPEAPTAARSTPSKPGPRVIKAGPKGSAMPASAKSRRKAH